MVTSPTAVEAQAGPVRGIGSHLQSRKQLPAAVALSTWASRQWLDRALMTMVLLIRPLETQHRGEGSPPPQSERQYPREPDAVAVTAATTSGRPNVSIDIGHHGGWLEEAILSVGCFPL